MLRWKPVLRQLLAGVTAALVLTAMLAPAASAAMGTSEDAAICQCPIHDHCPLQHGRHVCQMGGEAPTPGLAWSKCSAGQGFAALASLAPGLLGVAPILPVPPLLETIFSSAPGLVHRTSPPDVPPPKAL